MARSASGYGVPAIAIVRFETGIGISNSVSPPLVDFCYVSLVADRRVAGNCKGIFLGSGRKFIGRWPNGFHGNSIGIIGFGRSNYGAPLSDAGDPDSTLANGFKIPWSPPSLNGGPIAGQGSGKPLEPCRHQLN